MAETRRAPRHHVVKAGTIRFGGRTVNCLVRNLSTTGAALEITNQQVPQRFILVVPGDGLQMPSHVVWRKDHRIGVAFD